MKKRVLKEGRDNGANILFEKLHNPPKEKKKKKKKKKRNEKNLKQMNVYHSVGIHQTQVLQESAG